MSKVSVFCLSAALLGSAMQVNAKEGETQQQHINTLKEPHTHKLRERPTHTE